MFDKTHQKYVVILFLLGVFLFFYKLGAIPLLDPDEPRYAETAREMLESKDFLIPHFNYEPRLNKPPLEYWLISLSYLAFGINEFAARFPSAVFGIFGVFIVYLLGCRIYLSRSIGFLAGLILAASWEYLLIAHLATIDMMLCFFMLLAILFFVKFLDSEKKINIYGLCMSLGLAFLSKGPVGLIPLIIFIAYILASKKTALLKKLFFIPAILIFLIIGFSWYILVLFKLGLKEGLALFHEETVERFTAGYIHGEPFYYFLPVALAGFMPWTVFLPWIKLELKKDRLVIIWIAVVFLFFSLCKSKLPTYILVLFPAFSLIMAGFWQDVFLGKIRKVSYKISASLLFFLFIIAFSFLWTRSFVFKGYDIELKGGLFLIFIVTVGTIIAALILVVRKKMSAAFSAIISFSIIILFLFYGIFALQLAGVRSVKSFVAPVMEKIDSKDKVCAYKIKKQSLTFYLQRKVSFLDTEQALENFLNGKDENFLMIIKEGDYTKLKDRYNFRIENKQRGVILAHINK